MNLPPFIPKKFVVEVRQTIKPKGDAPKPQGLRRSEPQPRLVETARFCDQGEAEAYAALKSHEYDSVSYKGAVREAGPKDLAEQRLEEIAEAMATDLEATLKAEERIICYDTYTEGGGLDASGILVAPIEELAQMIYEEGPDPVRDGWVGSDGLP
jgi:hypothetical protein